MVGENLDLSSEPPSHGDDSDLGRRFLGIHFACCGVYSRVYINRDQTAYLGNCPKCSRRIRLTIAPHGTDQRFFTAY